MFCNCKGTLWCAEKHSKIKNIEPSATALKSLQEGHKGECIAVLKEPYNCYKIYHQTEYPINEKTPLLEVLSIVFCGPVQVSFFKQFSNESSTVEDKPCLLK